MRWSPPRAYANVTNTIVTHRRLGLCGTPELRFLKCHEFAHKPDVRADSLAALQDELVSTCQRPVVTVDEVCHHCRDTARFAGFTVHVGGCVVESGLVCVGNQSM